MVMELRYFTQLNILSFYAGAEPGEKALASPHPVAITSGFQTIFSLDFGS
jgi:hypothetical protein